MTLFQCALLALGITAIQAATLVVNNPTDTKDPVGSCSGDCNLRTAWHLAEGGDIISITVDPIMDDSISELKPTNNLYTLSGNVEGNENNRAFVSPKPGSENGAFFEFVNGFHGSLVVDNIEFNNFTATPSTYSLFTLAGSNYFGPEDGDIEFKNCNFIGIDSSEDAIIQISHMRSLTIHNCNFKDNKGTFASGGSCAGFTASGTVSIVDSTFSNNQKAQSIVGGGSDKFTIQNTNFDNNHGQYVVSYDQGAETLLELKSVFFSSNMASELLISTLSPMFISDSQFNGNQAPKALFSGYNVTLVDTTGTLTTDSPNVFYPANSGYGPHALALNKCKFTGTKVNIVNNDPSVQTIIYNLAPGSKAIAKGSTTAEFANCNQVLNGPLACGYGNYCVLVRSASKPVGYLCLTSEEVEAQEG